MDKSIKEIISKMTVEEKASLCSGLDFWNTKAVKRLGIPSIMMTDGPHGLRKQDESVEELFDINNSIPATCFPTASGLACSWDRKLVERVGIALGEECQAEGVYILLGPGANIKRSPLCGRNFEYFSEDPYLSTEIAASHIRGVQSQGVGASLKHFCANNQEHRRMTIDVVIDERTLREIYFASFEGAVKQSKPWTVMCSYNRINGEFGSQNKYTLTDVLRNEWGHDGFVVSDWGAVNDRVAGLEAGLELEMPSSGGERDKEIVDAVKNGRLSEEILDKAVERLLGITFRAVDNKKANATFDKKIHHELAREAARESMVLLKNENSILPIKREGTIALIGAFAKEPRYQGSGSSHVRPIMLESAYDGIIKSVGQKAEINYSQGYESENDVVDEKLINEAKEVAIKSDVAVVFVGLTEEYESEGYDRTHLRIPENHIKLIEAVAEVQSKTIVVLSNGSPIEMPWINKVKAVLETYLSGQATGDAVADVLFGDFSPCGKLAETFPVELSHNPSYLNFPGEGDRVEYREGLFVGYRYYDAKNIKPLFPFGFGLSYTNFEYTDIKLSKNEIFDTDVLNVSVRVKNTGKVRGKEIVQLYVRDVEKSVVRPDKELKGFEKVELDAGEEKTVTFALNKRAFAYYNTEIKDWYVETGDFEILIGKSSQEIVLKGLVRVNSTIKINRKYDINSTVGDIIGDPDGLIKANGVMYEYLKKFGMEKGLKETKKSTVTEMVKYTPLRALPGFSRGEITKDMVDELIKVLGNS
ncbi:glycoside hydrolase family 3 C-terminal domain-containing protein [Acetivibrio cellulolyticus]|uniref:glycoside hydrolase family 3 C-terminal domain-containing protein n=1 Tax=Acetivibrio cellulolyticus TaxID=35830 RepID=UPI0001E3057A|nr:glycoside hydrolase family 3 C-terminal domain-containing protein [Acetivibrio cellulolyticus]